MGSGGQPRLGSLHAEGGRRRRPLEEMAELLSSSMLEGGREWRHPGWDVRRRQRETMGSRGGAIPPAACGAEATRSC
jgi:hypothetical protein